MSHSYIVGTLETTTIFVSIVVNTDMSIGESEACLFFLHGNNKIHFEMALPQFRDF